MHWSRLPCYEAKCVQCRCFQCRSVPLRSDIKGTELPPANILIPLKRQLIALQLCRWQFLYNETLQQTSRPLLSKLVWKTTNLGIWSHFEDVRGGVEPWLMARWKAHIRRPVRHNWISFLSLTVEALRGKMCQNSLPSGGGGSVWAKISGGSGRPLPIYWYHSKGNWLRYNFAADSFYIMKLCSRLLVLCCQNLYERRQI